jgi:hypothetical protein
MHNKTIAALAVAALAGAAAVTLAPAHADPGCAALANNLGTQYDNCVNAAGGIQHWQGIGALATVMHGTTTYPDGGHDECDWQGSMFPAKRTDSVHCAYLPPTPENPQLRTIAAAPLAALALSVGVAHTDPQCYQKLFYRICLGPDGQWRIDPTPALPITGQPPPPPEGPQ